MLAGFIILKYFIDSADIDWEEDPSGSEHIPVIRFFSNIDIFWGSGS
jgi:hypothetical protein